MKRVGLRELEKWYRSLAPKVTFSAFNHLRLQRKVENEIRGEWLEKDKQTQVMTLHPSKSQSYKRLWEESVEKI